MNREPATLYVQVRPREGEDEQLVDDLTRGLQRELRDLDVDDVKPATRSGDAAGAKAGDVVEIGSLIVQLGLQAQLLKSAVDLTLAWIARQSDRSVKLTLDGDDLEVTGVSSRKQRELIDTWLARHARDD